MRDASNTHQLVHPRSTNMRACLARGELHTVYTIHSTDLHPAVFMVTIDDSCPSEQQLKVSEGGTDVLDS